MYEKTNSDKSLVSVLTMQSYELYSWQANNFSKPDDFFSENQSFSLLIQKKAVSLQQKTNDNSN